MEITKPRIFAVIDSDDVRIETNFLGKFTKDEVYYEDTNYVFAMCGAILNSDKLYGDSSLKEYILNALHSDDEVFFKNFRGNFAGIVYDKRRHTCLAFTDQFCSEQLYYAMRGGADNYQYISP